MALTLVFGIYLHQKQQVLASKRAVMKLKDQYKQLGLKIEEIKQIQEELTRLTAKQAVFNSITRNEPYSQVLLRLAKTMNENTWLTQLTVEGSRDRDSGGRVNLRLEGFSHSNKDLGNFMNQLSNDPIFKSVVLQYAKESHSKGTASPHTLIRFQIKSHV
jgi:Tfp pilus assembly protein PilN